MQRESNLSDSQNSSVSESAVPSCCSAAAVTIPTPLAQPAEEAARSAVAVSVLPAAAAKGRQIVLCNIFPHTESTRNARANHRDIHLVEELLSKQV